MSQNTVFVPSLSNTQIKLYSKFIEFRKEKPTEKITVVELCKEAHVNRSTFYRSYYDIFDLEEKIEDYCVSSVLDFCVNLNFPFFASEMEKENYVPEIPHFDDGIAIAALHAMGRTKSLSQKLFDRLLEFFPVFIREDSTKEEIAQLKSIFCFIITGAIQFCAEASPNKNESEAIYQVSLVAFYSFKVFLDHFNNHEPFGELPISDEEDLSLPQKKERLNVRKTKRNLQRAFLELLKKHKDEKISVMELCEKAEVCSSTFYTHYNSIEDYSKSIIDEILDGFYEITKVIYSHIGEDKLKIKDLIFYIEKSQKFLDVFISSKGYNKFSRYPKIFINSFFKFIKKDYDCKFEEKPAFAFICYCAWGMIFEPFYDHELSTTYIFKLAYFVFINLFYRRKEKPEEEIQN